MESAAVIQYDEGEKEAYEKTVQQNVWLSVFGISIAGTLGLPWIISRVVSGKIPHIDMVEALNAKND